VPSFDELPKLHHPEDWPALKEICDIARKQPEIQTVDVRILRPDNSVRYINIIGKPVVGDNGEVTRVYGTVMDINARKLAEKNLQQHNDELQRINRQLDRFVYSATHDLRAPLMSMKGLVNLAQIDTEPAQQEKYYQMMLRSIEKLDNIIRDIVDISRNRRTDVQTEKIDFTVLTREIQEGLSHLPGADGIAVRVDIKGTVPFYSDVKRLGVMFNNLLSNAFRYSDSEKDDSFVEVDVDVTDREAVIRISDNGIGIGNEHLPRIFDMFYRATDSRDGTGLGLYLVKEIVDILGGTVQLQSQLKAGTIFTIILPNRKP
jgi:signal transduction histidine kinase